MLLADEPMRVIHVSTHVSLREACDRCKKERIIEVYELIDDACRQFGIDNPHIAIAGLNPHCSENGLFGWEEAKEIIPAVEELKARGFNVEGLCHRTLCSRRQRAANMTVSWHSTMTRPTYL